MENENLQKQDIFDDVAQDVEDVGVQTENEITTAPIEQDQPDSNVTQDKPIWAKLDKWADILIWVVVITLISLSLLKLFVISTITVDGISMYSKDMEAIYGASATYLDGDKVTVAKVAKPKRGQVAVFYKYPIDSKVLAYFASPAQSQVGGKYALLIKRVVAVEGDAIWLEDYDGVHRLVVLTPDGKTIYEDYYTDRQGNAIPLMTMEYNLGQLAKYTADNPLTIPQGCFFAMGDNREDSLDSRGTSYDTDVTLYTFDRVVGVVVN